MKKFLNFKNFSVLMLLITICILSLTAVFAADHGVSGNSFTSIQTAINSSGNNDRVLLGSDTYTGSGNPLHLGGDKNITIQGQSNSNRATLDAKNLSGFLYIESGSTATIRYVNFINMDNDNHGIGAYGTVIIENCNFYNSKGDSGTAVYINSTADNSIIRNSNFVNNNANNHDANDYTAGGAVCVNGANNVKITNSNFSNNRALDHGGALMIRHGGTVQISGCTFTNNIAPQGGAIALIDGSSVTIQNCKFTNNKANTNGGAIYFSSSSRSTITGSSTFTGNSAKYGGAIYSNSPLYISSAKFSKNKATNYGGAIYSKNALNISGGSITGNTASYGSGIYNLATLRLIKVELKSNIAKVISISLKIPTVVKKGKKLTINVYLKTGDNIAGAIFNKNGNTYVEGTRITPSANTPGKTFSSSIASNKKKIKSNSKGVATRTYTVSKTAKKVAVSVSYSQSGKKWIISKSVKVSATAPSKPKTKKYTNKKSVSSSSSSSTGSSKGGTSVTVGFSNHANAHLASLVDMSQYKISSMKISYWNLKKTTTSGMTDYLYKVNKDGWYSGKINSKNGVDWKKIGSKPTISGTWFNLSSDSKGKYTIGNIVPKYTNNTSHSPLSFFVSVKNKISHSSLTPYIKYTYNLVNKKTGSKTTKTFFEKATTDIYFKKDPNLSSAYDKYLKGSKKAPINNQTIKKLVISIISKIDGEITSKSKSKKLFEWVRDNIQYDYYECTKYGAVRTLSVKSANCVDQSNLLISMLRTSKIVSRYEHYKHCYFYRSEDDYGHVWVSVYNGNKWNQLDPTSSRNGYNVIKNFNYKTKDQKHGPHIFIDI